jgi:glutamate dehydrogenase
MDYIGVKLFSPDGGLAGELRIVGLFTSTAYTRSTRSIPILRRKVERVIAKAGYDPEGHSGKALANVLESYPRDELFQIDEETLLAFALEIVALEERPRVRALVRSDKFERYVSVIVFVPRDRYDSGVRERIGASLAGAFDGRISAHYPAFPEGMRLARVHFIIGRSGGRTPTPASRDLEAGIAAIVRTWADGLRVLLSADADADRAARLIDRYGESFPPGYRNAYGPDTALADIALFERLTAAAPLAIGFHRSDAGEDGAVGLKLMHRATPIALSERVPMLEHMSFRVIDERSYEVVPAGDEAPVHVHDMELESADGQAVDLGQSAERLTACLHAVWSRRADDDGFNGLVLAAGLTWREAALVRSVSRFLHQAGTPYAQGYVAGTLNRHAGIARMLVDLFRARFDPLAADEDAAAAIAGSIETALENVASLDEDLIIRRFANVIGAMLRTNFFQETGNGGTHAEISFKLDSRRIEGLPEPRPFREIFVHSPRVEGIHLRFGKVARGGIRWSDRPQDFRTEILGLVKAQQVKNAVIVPVGAKGGFVARQAPVDRGRAAVLAEGEAAYRVFIGSLLDITDNLDGEKTVAPGQVVRHDDDDPYLVVAADKGTAGFSDVANEIADAHGFWLGDAFASGGSAGYDHKAMGITARGAWEAVKRHFREFDTDIATTPFTVAGVGDMSGDVFGNAMVLSRQIRLVAAFDHRDIFIDPDPDPAVSFAERRRLSRLARSSWQDYRRDRLSAGGGVFSRADKSIRLNQEIRDLLALSGARATPQEVMRAILRAPVDLMWFGGVGTFVKGAAEGDSEVGDRANDAIRITAAELRARVVGEGANLALTQRARIEFGLAGGRCNSDAIDNSAGVNTSDLEVNIKIALRRALADGRIDRPRRDRLLGAMTDAVADLALRNNYLQTLAISLAERRGFEAFGLQRRLMHQLEARGLLNRTVEALPDEAALTERQKAGKPLTRAEIGILLAYAKLALFADLLAADVIGEPALAGELIGYFPSRMHRRWRREIEDHRLRREIIATVLANSMVNRGGPTYTTRIADRTGAPVAAIARAYVVVRDSFGLRDLNGAIDGLDGAISGAVQLGLYGAVQDLLLDETVWFVRNDPFAGGVGAAIDVYAPAVDAIGRDLDGLLPARLAERVAEGAAAHRAAGVPADIAARIAGLPDLAAATDIRLAATEAGAPLRRTASVFFAVGEHLRIGRIAAMARALPIADYYDGLALDQALETLGAAQRRIAVAALAAGGDESAPLDAWLKARRPENERMVDVTATIAEADEISVARVSVVAGLLRDLSRH